MNLYTALSLDSGLLSSSGYMARGPRDLPAQLPSARGPDRSSSLSVAGEQTQVQPVQQSLSWLSCLPG